MIHPLVSAAPPAAGLAGIRVFTPAVPRAALAHPGSLAQIPRWFLPHQEVMQLRRQAAFASVDRDSPSLLGRQVARVIDRVPGPSLFGDGLPARSPVNGRGALPPSASADAWLATKDAPSMRLMASAGDADIPVAQGDFFMDREAAEEQSWVKWAAQMADTAFGALDDVQRRRYVHLARTPPLVDPSLKVIAEVERELCSKLGISSLDGYWIHTDLSGVSAAMVMDGVASRRMASGTLRDFLRHGVDASVLGRTAAAERFIGRTSINQDRSNADSLPKLDIRQVLQAIRDIDPGRRLESWLRGQFGDTFQSGVGLWSAINKDARNRLELAILDVRRLGTAPAADLDLLESLLGDNPSAAIGWSQLIVQLGDQSIDFPALLLHMPTSQDGKPYYTYIPGMAREALCAHAGKAEVAGYLAKLSVANADENIGINPWLLNALTRRDQLQVLTLFNAPKVDEAALNPLAKVLYQWFGKSRGSASPRIEVRSAPARAVSVVGALAAMSAQRMRNDALFHFKSNANADLERAWQRFKRVGNEVLEYLMMPMPGAVALPGRNALFMLGIGYQAVQLPGHVLRGEAQSALQDMSDLVDFAVGIKGAAYAGKVARRIPANLHVVNRGDGSVVAWSPRDLAIHSEGGFPPGGVEGRDGIWRRGDDLRARVAVPEGGERVVRVVEQGGRVRWRYPALGNAGPLLERGNDGMWRIQSDDASALSDAQLLRNMLRPDLRLLNDLDVEHVLRAAGTNRAELDRMWAGRSKVPAGLGQAVSAALARRRASLLGERVRTRSDASLNAEAERMVIARLADMAGCELKVFDARGRSTASYLPRGWEHNDGELAVLALVQQGAWSYQLHQRGVTHDQVGDVFALVAALRESLPQARPQGWPGATSFGERATRLREQCADWLSDGANRDMVLAAMQHHGRLKGQVARGEGLLLPVTWSGGSSEYPAWRVMARRTYPALDEATLDEARQRFRGLEGYRGVDFLPVDAQRWLDANSLERRAADARMAIESPEGHGLTLDAEAMAVNLLRRLPGFPANTAIVVRDAAGRLLLGWGPLLAAEHIALVRQSSRGGFYFYEACSATKDRIPAMAGQNSLVSSLLQAMNDRMRLALGLNVNDARMLQDLLVPRGGSQPGMDAVEPAALIGSPLTAAELKSFTSSQADMRLSEPGPDGIHRADDGRTYLTIGGRTYRTLHDPSAGHAGEAVWRIVRDDDPAAMQGNVHVPGVTQEHVMVFRAYGDWRKTDTAASNTPSSELLAFRVSDHEALDALRRQSLRNSDARTYRFDGQPYVRMGDASSDVFFRVSSTEANGSVEVLDGRSYKPAPTGRFIAMEGGWWRERALVSDVATGAKGALSSEAADNLRVMESTRHFVGVMHLKSKRIDLGISRQLGNPGSDVDRNLPAGVTFKVGPSSPHHAVPLEALHSIGQSGGKAFDLTGHALMVKMLAGNPDDYVGFAGIKRNDDTVKLKWTSRTLNPQHAPFVVKHHLGNPGETQRDYVLAKNFRLAVIRQFERSGFHVLTEA